MREAQTTSSVTAASAASLAPAPPLPEPHSSPLALRQPSACDTATVTTAGSVPLGLGGDGSGAATVCQQYPPVVALAERLFFRTTSTSTFGFASGSTAGSTSGSTSGSAGEAGGGEWVEDAGQHTDWEGSGYFLPLMRGAIARRAVAPAPSPSPADTRAPGSAGTPLRATGGGIGASLGRAPSAPDTTTAPASGGAGLLSPVAMGSSPPFVRLTTVDSVGNTTSTSAVPAAGAGAGMAGRQSSVSTLDVKAMIGEAKRRSDQRQRRDHQARPPAPPFPTSIFLCAIASPCRASPGQYMHRLAFAAVRVAPSGFVWLLNASGKVRHGPSVRPHCAPDPHRCMRMCMQVSDAPLNAEREALSAKKLQELRSFSAAVVVAYAVLIDVAEAAMALSDNDNNAHAQAQAGERRAGEAGHDEAK
jgi:hypothetical protein